MVPLFPFHVTFPVHCPAYMVILFQLVCGAQALPPQGVSPCALPRCAGALTVAVLVHTTQHVLVVCLSPPPVCRLPKGRDLSLNVYT
jgi:hypothetical protein